MSDDNSGTTEVQSLSEFGYGTLMNVARSAREQFDEVEIDTDAPKKHELVEEMQEVGIEPEWEYNGEEIELLPVQTPDSTGSGNTGPTDATVLYCLTRAETTQERVEEISEALAEAGYELRETGGGDKFSIVLPAEAQEGFEEAEEAEDDEDSAESGQGAAVAESEESEEDSPEEEEDDESGADGDDEEVDDDDEEEPAGVNRGAVRGRLEDKNKDKLYGMAVEEDIDGRSDMTKDELIEALLDEMEGVAAA